MEPISFDSPSTRNHPFRFIECADKMPGRWHEAYLSVYARLFPPLRDTEDSIAEVGVGGGGSLLMYADYFHRAKAFGMDILPEPRVIGGHPRVHYHQSDAYSPEGIETMRAHAPFALIIDDGPHTLASQKTFCANYPGLLSPEGLCIIEDVQNPEHFAQLAAAVPSEFFTSGIDLRWHSRAHDNLLFIIQRR
jgi:hypothetical protein